MNKSILVFHNQFAQFKREKGMLFFYCLSIALIGIIIPIFMRSIESSLTMAALLTAMFLKPILSDSLAGEREQRTLETLLSSPMNGKSIIWGKFLFCLFFAVFFFVITTLCAALTSRLMGYETTLLAWQWTGIMLLAVLNFSAISIAGVHASATSGDMRIANSRISLIVYPLGLLFLIFLTVTLTVEFLPAFIVGLTIILIYLCVILIFVAKAIKMKQSNYFENIQIKKGRKVHENHTLKITPKSQFMVVFGFEMKYLLTLKILLLNFGILCFAPALFACLLPFYAGVPSYTGKLEINYAVLITALMIPRIPTNLIAYSIGGEKAYKTGESLLSTPLNTRPVFLAKCMIPILVTAIMLILSSLFTLIGANIVTQAIPNVTPIHGYTAEQLVLLFPVSVMTSISMMFISFILSVILKTPRQGLYATSIVSFLFVVPVLAIVYLTQNTLMWSVIYSVILLICNAICVMSISDKISRPQIISRL